MFIDKNDPFPQHEVISIENKITSLKGKNKVVNKGKTVSINCISKSESKIVSGKKSKSVKKRGIPQSKDGSGPIKVNYTNYTKLH